MCKNNGESIEDTRKAKYKMSKSDCYVSADYC